MRGVEDRIVAESAAIRLATLLGAELVSVQGAGHLVPLEKPESVIVAIETFFQKFGAT